MKEVKKTIMKFGNVVETVVILLFLSGIVGFLYIHTTGIIGKSKIQPLFVQHAPVNTKLSSSDATFLTDTIQEGTAAAPRVVTCTFTPTATPLRVHIDVSDTINEVSQIVTMNPGTTFGQLCSFQSNPYTFILNVGALPANLPPAPNNYVDVQVYVYTPVGGSTATLRVYRGATRPAPPPPSMPFTSVASSSTAAAQQILESR